MTSVADPQAQDFDLTDKYRPNSGPVLLTGVQAIARMLIENHSRERRVGRNVASFVSGYQGSPLAAVDKVFGEVPDLDAHAITFVPGLNEELGATSVWGSQQELPKGTRTHDGVVGVWYGKGPGLDRASDAFRHAAMYGAHPKGGAIALVGDDPAAKSSTVPAASERSLAALSMPVLFPRNAEEVIAFGMFGIELSRASGTWPAMKLVADVCDGLWTLNRDFTAFHIEVPDLEWEGRPWTYRQRVMAAPPDSVLAEADLYGPRWEMVQAMTAANHIDRIEVDPADAWLGIVAVGTAYDSVRQALSELGLHEDDLVRAGIRILRVGMPYPLGEQQVRALADGVDTVFVVEDKMSFVESQVIDILYGSTDAPRVLGKRDDRRRPLIPSDGELTAARLLAPLRRVLDGRVTVNIPKPPPPTLTLLDTKRTAYFCSGCPHNRSTAVPDGSLAGGGIGCHTLVTMSSRTDSQVTGLTQMGGEGAQWIGQAPYTDVEHIFQNVGDGTYFHSGQLAVQACVAAGVNITYKILFNAAVAMTGAQDAEGGLTVPQLTHKLTSEGVAKIIVCAEDPGRHPKGSLADGVLLWDRDRLDEAQRLLRDVEGVTVLIYDQQCAAEARRKRKRGTLPTRRTRVIINEAACEGCGDCGVKSNCLSVQPVETEFGRKTRIDQTSCNTDYTCMDGDCPAFVTVELPEEGAALPKKEAPHAPEVPAPETAALTGTHNIFLAGIGGTGIVTVNQVLGTAALRAGLHVEGLDQTGLSQKAGPVTSHLRLGAEAPSASNRVSPSSADCVLAFDLLTAADAKHVGVGDPERTVTVASTSRTATGEMVYDRNVAYPADSSLLDRVGARARRVVSFDAAEAADAIFGHTATANFLLVGAAYQEGALPIPAASIEEAIAVNGVAVAANQEAFRWGRVAVADPAAFAAATAAATVANRSDTQVPTDLFVGTPLSGEVRDLVERRAAQLVAHSGRRAAAGYLREVESVWVRERALTERTDLSAAVATSLHRLTAYKDEYEVARMLTDKAFVASVAAEVPGASDLTYQLHPPVLRALGREKKIGFGPRSHVALRVLAKGRFLRGTKLDPFGRAEVRKVERRLLDHYRGLVDALLADLTDDSYAAAVEVARAPELVVGYEDVKLRNVDRYRARLGELGIDTSPIR
ncbi:indolepyruvate ferredoxin oxidoreductase family protein [Gordonia sp. (in: high G+C Gram-positive bacteria)]|uniref:indolepyruvate ferredoxin oxidoreductase family protein n=1 Tax=Gordonia sp. (in: high G+C Gram-positive bacteria) TaxID=84139 RepID=UPI0016A8AE5A|nr:indolepyruvate ferredoxin oxidoreductase family protein [Gordonia sp. (in: high G+C Gram-positive bacteria)]NLG45136.1 indolepyruvate ferredoxin oxidoreductase family protein [Gordonia sp. (in: high G+C Gram-positive bacteria)]